MNSGYSGRPLIQKLGFKSGMRARVENAPPDYWELLGPKAAEVRWFKTPVAELQAVHAFVLKRGQLQRTLRRYRNKLSQSGMLWVSWPKQSSGVSSEVNENLIRELALPLGWVDVKVCAVDQTWSGLKLVIRRELRR